jgi:hypothetical protein
MAERLQHPATRLNSYVKLYESESLLSNATVAWVAVWFATLNTRSSSDRWAGKGKIGSIAPISWSRLTLYVTTGQSGCIGHGSTFEYQTGNLVLCSWNDLDFWKALKNRSKLAGHAAVALAAAHTKTEAAVRGKRLLMRRLTFEPSRPRRQTPAGGARMIFTAAWSCQTVARSGSAP